MSDDFILAPGEEFLQCPYNPAHIITDARMIFHLDKCRHSYYTTLGARGKDPVMGTCSFNWTHQCPKLELAIHERFCPNRLNQEKPLEFAPTTQNTKPNASSTTLPGGEDWESESQDCGAGYDPTPKLNANVLLYVPKGMTKSERRAHMKELRKRAAASEANFSSPTQLVSSERSISSQPQKSVIAWKLEERYAKSVEKIKDLRLEDDEPDDWKTAGARPRSTKWQRSSHVVPSKHPSDNIHGAACTWTRTEFQPDNEFPIHAAVSSCSTLKDGVEKSTKDKYRKDISENNGEEDDFAGVDPYCNNFL